MSSKSGFLAAAMERKVESGNLTGAGKGMPRRTLTFTMDHTVCVPGIFEEDFEITVGALTPRLELEASKQAKGDPTTMAFLMAKLSVMQVNGDTVSAGRGQLEFLWEALDQGGRQIVVAMFSKIGAPDEDALGKAEESVTLG